MTGGAHDTLRDQLVLDMARRLCKAAKPTPTGPVPCPDHMGEARSLFLIARRFADAQVADVRERIAADLEEDARIADTMQNMPRRNALRYAAHIVREQP